MLAAGMNDYLSKPIMPTALKAMLAKWLIVPAVHPAPDGLVEASGYEEEMPKAKQIFDRAGYLERMMGDLDLAGRLAGIFQSETPAMLTALQESLQCGNLAQAADYAHNLKGSAATVNGYAMSEEASAMEVAGHAGDRADMAARLPVLRRHFESLAASLQQEL